MLCQSHADSSLPKNFVERHINEVGDTPGQLKQHLPEQGDASTHLHSPIPTI
ncbi:Hypothetical protein P9303_17001 [Prochlorococcus marinus str. MIT 9303]|uniref:Uncharacterized protein n=1 Tax=Prochlorococcus marinus (strain MIT 9303) TaxID=59922 RepID=A2CAD4_PROM3|nr:Hypothetical protein P9303_17001 [Prochlorococcus marinus str. MIT 9303]